jgi:cytochrome b561
LNWRNTTDSYGLISIFLHWLVAAAAIGLFALGVWMVDLGYYDPWYQRAPHLHKSVGVLLLGVMLARLAWRRSNPAPRLIGSALHNRLAAAVHGLLYVLLLALIVSGYLISTADGRAIQVFDLFSVPATLSGLQNQADIAGRVHKLLGYTLMAVTALHAGAALKHHFVDRDRTLKRMLSSEP